jgi:RNase P subunit RPR2
MTYKLDDKLKWIGFCDDCNKPFQPQFIYPKTEKGDRRVCIYGTCVACDRQNLVGENWLDKYKSEGCFASFYGVWTNRDYVKELKEILARGD